MNIIKTLFEGLLIIEPRVHSDSRGYFFEAFNERLFAESGIPASFVQENQSKSTKNTIRGLHYQRAPHDQTKFIRVIRGVILDVVLDLRKEQSTYKQVFSVELSADNKRSVLVPKGFAHGYSVLSDEAEIVYCCDAYYAPEFESGIRYDDPTLGIDWRVSKEAIVSEKDLKLPLLSSIS